MRAQRALVIVQHGFGEGGGFGSMQQMTFGHQGASGRLHETGFHLDGDHTRCFVHTAICEPKALRVNC